MWELAPASCSGLLLLEGVLRVLCLQMLQEFAQMRRHRTIPALIHSCRSLQPQGCTVFLPCRPILCLWISQTPDGSSLVQRLSPHEHDSLTVEQQQQVQLFVAMLLQSPILNSQPRRQGPGKGGRVQRPDQVHRRVQGRARRPTASSTSQHCRFGAWCSMVE